MPSSAAIVIQPCGAMANVRTIDSIKILRNGCGLALKEAKHLVESMVESGSAELPLEYLVDRLE